MSPTQLAQHLASAFPGKLAADRSDDPKHPRVEIDAADWRPIAEHLRNHPDLDFDWLACLTALDYVATDKLAVCYDLRSTRHDHLLAIKVFIARNTAEHTLPAVPSVADLWPAAEWHEREAYDLLGIAFPGNPDLRRILLPDDWQGHPLRKDYAFPREYHGIPGSYELDWQQQPNYPK